MRLSFNEGKPFKNGTVLYLSTLWLACIVIVGECVEGAITFAHVGEDAFTPMWPMPILIQFCNRNLSPLIHTKINSVLPISSICRSSKIMREALSSDLVDCNLSNSQVGFLSNQGT